MKKSEAVRRFNEGKHFVETCLEDIASLDQSNDKELRKALRGTVMVEISDKAAKNFGKVCCYVLDGEDGAQKLKDELFDLKEKVVQLYNGADRQNLVSIKRYSEAIISEIKEVEKWTDDDHFIPDPIPETGDKTKALPPDMIEVFDSENDYNKLMDDLIMLKTTKQIAVRLLNDENLKWVNITNKVLYNHLKKKGIIKIGYSAFCKSLNKNS